VATDFFVSTMPTVIPFREAITYISGIIEMALALLLIYRPTRKKTGIMIAIFLLLIFPVNIYMAFDSPSIFLLVRLPLQFILIWWVLAVSENWPLNKTKLND